MCFVENPAQLLSTALFLITFPDCVYAFLFSRAFRRDAPGRRISFDGKRPQNVSPEDYEGSPMPLRVDAQSTQLSTSLGARTISDDDGAVSSASSPTFAAAHLRDRASPPAMSGLLPPSPPASVHLDNILDSTYFWFCVAFLYMGIEQKCARKGLARQARPLNACIPVCM